MASPWSPGRPEFLTRPDRPRVAGMIAGAGLGAVVTCPAIGAAIVSGGLGHGHYEATRALFPAPMLLTLWTHNTISVLSMALAILQFPLYGVVLGASRGYKAWRTTAVILGLHGLAVWGCFSGLIPNFS